MTDNGPKVCVILAATFGGCGAQNSAAHLIDSIVQVQTDNFCVLLYSQFRVGHGVGIIDRNPEATFGFNKQIDTIP